MAKINPKARVNITLDIAKNGASKKLELPLKIKILGDFSNSLNKSLLTNRDNRQLNKQNFDSVLAKLVSSIPINIPCPLKNDGSTVKVNVPITKMKDFSPDNIIMNVDYLKKIMAVRNLIKNLKANMLDDKEFRVKIRDLFKDETAIEQIKDNIKYLA